MKAAYATFAELKPLVGREIAVSEWITIDQARIDAFADATLDRQWIHVDRERAARGPFGTTIAHGFLTLSLLPAFFESAFEVAEERMGINYGLNRVRFTAPVPAGSRVRGRFKLLSHEPVDGGVQLVVEVTVEREGGERPVCVAESVTRRFA
jgi:acyl dehydratase